MKEDATFLVNLGYTLCSISFYLGFLNAFKNLEGENCKPL